MAEQRKYLNDSELDSQLADKGYVVAPFLNPEEVEFLKSKFEEAHPSDTAPFYATAHHQSPDFRREMSDIISQVLRPHVQEVLFECDLLGATFIVKSKDDASLLQPHQDWNIVDENEFRSFNIWIPLVDLNEQNGAIEVLPESHKWIRGYRHSSIDCAYRKVHSLVWEHMKPLYLKAGEALIYDHALLHASKANRTDEKRLACASGLKPSGAEMFFYWNNSGVVEQYKSNPDFFMTQNIFEGPSGLEKVAQLPYDFPAVEEAEFYGFLGLEPPKIEVQQVPQKSNAAEKPFWKVYTPGNILKEIHYRLTSGNN